MGPRAPHRRTVAHSSVDREGACPPGAWEGTTVNRMKRAVVAIAVIALGTGGCGESGTGTGTTAAPVQASPRPAGTGPLTKEVVRIDLDTSVAAVGVPANAPEYARPFEDAPAGSPPSCAVAFRGIGDETAPLDFDRFKAVVGELRERDWQQSGG